MADLVVEGPESYQRWRRALTEGVSEVVGRMAGGWAVPWDDRISRSHFRMEWDGKRLLVEKLPRALNAVFFRGEKRERFEMVPGERFVVGATTFTLAASQASPAPGAARPDLEQGFDAETLRASPFRQPDRRLAAISRLPDIIATSASDEESNVRLVSLLLSGIEGARAVALVHERRVGDQWQPHVLQWDQRLSTGDDFRPSSRLIRAAGERGQSVVHIWNQGGQGSGRYPAEDQSLSDRTREGRPTDYIDVNAESPMEATLWRGADWAFVCPIPGESTVGWSIYVAGAFPRTNPEGIGADWLQDDLKLAEFAARTFGRLRDGRLAARRQAGLRQFFAPIVLEALARQGGGDDPLAPRETDVTVLFCDLRGFSRKSEESSGDLMGLLERVSRALGVMTRQILATGGVVGDFHGDAAMGFWGWPLPQADAARRACEAAQAIRHEFEAAATEEGSVAPLAGFQVGIGVATGRAVAGKIGSIDQVKVTVFGPVANLASRLEGMTKMVRASILLDEATASKVRGESPTFRLRRVAKALPKGMERPVEVVELLPSLDSPVSVMTDADVVAYEAGLTAFIAGDWRQAVRELQKVNPDDQVKDLLTAVITDHQRQPPPGWDGVIRMTEK